MSFIGNAVKRFKGGYAARIQSLEKFGVFSYKDEHVTSRIVTLGELLGKFWEKDIDERVKILDAIIDTIAGPWGEGGDTAKYFNAYGSWKLLLGRFASMNRQLGPGSNGEKLSRKNGDGGNGEEMFSKMAQISSEKHLIPYGWMIVEASWKSKHINAATPIVIQSNSPYAPSKDVPVGFGPTTREASQQ